MYKGVVSLFCTDYLYNATDHDSEDSTDRKIMSRILGGYFRMLKAGEFKLKPECVDGVMQLLNNHAGLETEGDAIKFHKILREKASDSLFIGGLVCERDALKKKIIKNKEQASKQLELSKSLLDTEKKKCIELLRKHEDFGSAMMSLTDLEEKNIELKAELNRINEIYSKNKIESDKKLLESEELRVKSNNVLTDTIISLQSELLEKDKYTCDQEAKPTLTEKESLIDSLKIVYECRSCLDTVEKKSIKS